MNKKEKLTPGQLKLLENLRDIPGLRVAHSMYGNPYYSLEGHELNWKTIQHKQWVAITDWLEKTPKQSGDIGLTDYYQLKPGCEFTIEWRDAQRLIRKEAFLKAQAEKEAKLKAKNQAQEEQYAALVKALIHTPEEFEFGIGPYGVTLKFGGCIYTIT